MWGKVSDELMLLIVRTENKPNGFQGNARPPPRGFHNNNNNWNRNNNNANFSKGGNRGKPNANNGQRQWNNDNNDSNQNAQQFPRGGKPFKGKPRGGKGRGGN